MKEKILFGCTTMLFCGCLAFSSLFMPTASYAATSVPVLPNLKISALSPAYEQNTNTITINSVNTINTVEDRTKNSGETDEHYANFRDVATVSGISNIKSGRLFRGWSPVDTDDSIFASYSFYNASAGGKTYHYLRSETADTLLKNNNVQVMINFGDNIIMPDDDASYVEISDVTSRIAAFKEKYGYTPYYESKYTSDSWCYVNWYDGWVREGHPIAWAWDNTKTNFAKAAKLIGNNKGKSFYAHCHIGRDRTGFFCFLMEALCEESYTSMLKDFAMTYSNTVEDIKTIEAAENNADIQSTFAAYYAAIGTSSSASAKVVSEKAASYLKSGGCNDSDITNIKTALMATQPTLSVSNSSVSCTLPSTSASITYSYNGNGTVSASSSNTGIATVNISGSKITVSPVSAGTATITVSSTETETSYEASTTFTVTVSKKTPTLSLSSSSGSIVYPNNGSFTYSYDGDGELSVATSNSSIATATLNKSNKTVTLGSSGTVGTAEITLSAAASTNCNAISKKYTVSVTSGAIAIQKHEFSGTYDGEKHSSSITSSVSGVTISYSATESGTYSSTAPSWTDAGTYTTYYKAEKTGYSTETGTLSTVIAKKTPTLSANNTLNMPLKTQNKYDLKYSYNGDGTISVASNAPTIATATTDSTTQKVSINTLSSAGSATITISATAGKNYSSSKIDIPITVDTKEISAEAITSTLPYSGSAACGVKINVTEPTSGAVITYGTEEGEYTLAEPPAHIAPGTYTVYYMVTADGYSPKEGNTTYEIKEPAEDELSTETSSNSTAKNGETLTFKAIFPGSVDSCFITWQIKKPNGEWTDTDCHDISYTTDSLSSADDGTLIRCYIVDNENYAFSTPEQKIHVVSIDNEINKDTDSQTKTTNSQTKTENSTNQSEIAATGDTVPFSMIIVFSLMILSIVLVTYKKH